MSRNTIYIIVIVFLLVTNIATVVSVREISRRVEEDTRPVMEMASDSRMGFFVGSLGLTQDQLPEFRKFNIEYNREVAAINRRLMTLRHQMITEISDNDPDNNVIDSVLNEFGAGHIELKRATIDYYDNLKSICSQEQRDNLQIFFRDMLDPQGPIYSRGPMRDGRGHGMGPGRNRQFRGGRFAPQQ